MNRECPHCNKLMNCGGMLAGQYALCPYCGKRFRMPSFLSEDPKPAPRKSSPVGAPRASASASRSVQPSTGPSTARSPTDASASAQASSASHALPIQQEHGPETPAVPPISKLLGPLFKRPSLKPSEEDPAESAPAPARAYAIVPFRPYTCAGCSQRISRDEIACKCECPSFWVRHERCMTGPSGTCPKCKSRGILWKWKSTGQGSGH